VAVEVALGTRMSCIGSVSRGEDNGSDKDDKLHHGQQGRTPPRPSVPCGNRAIQMEQGEELPDPACALFVCTRSKGSALMQINRFCRWHLSPMIAAQIDQNQCRRLKGYYGFEHPKSGAEPAVSAVQADVSLSSLCRERAEKRL